MADYTVGDTVYKRFTTRAFATGVPTTLAGTPVVSAYEDDSVTQITAGITLGVDHDSVTGLNLLTIVATGANGFEDGKSYDLVITTGTVGGVSVVGEVVWHFTLSAEAAAVDLANGTDGLGAIKADTATILTDTADMQPKLGTPAGADMSADIATIDANVDSVLADTGTDGVLLAATATSAQLVDDVWDEPLTGGTHNVATSSGRRLRELADSAAIVDSGTAQAGGANTITLAASASSTDGTYDPGTVVITGGTGQGQARFIIEYTGATRVAAVSRDWRTNPDATSEYIVLASAQTPHVNEGLAQAGATSTITLNAVADSVDDVYNGQLIHLVSGTGQDQARKVLDYNGTTKVATVDPAWDTTPDATTGYLMLPDGDFDSFKQAAYPRGVELDTNASNTNTLVGRDGTIGNPVSTIAAAITLATALNTKRIHVATGSSWTMDQSFANYELVGNNWTLALGGQAITGAFIMGATISGTFTNTGAIMEDCIINAVTGPGMTMRRCFLNEVAITNNGTAGWFLNDCRSRVAGTGSPNFDFGATTANTDLNMRNYSGGIELENMGQLGTDTASIEGFGNITLNANCTGGTLARRGVFDFTDNAGGAVTVVEDELTEESGLILADTNELQTDWTDGGRLDLIIDAILADTNELQSDDVPGLIAALNDLSAAQVNTEVADVIFTDTIAELSQAAPAATPTVGTALMLLYMMARNKVDITATLKEVHNDAGTVITKKTLSDDGTTYSEAEMASGP